MSTDTTTIISFDERLRRLVRKHRRMAEAGVVARMGRDGLVLPMPRRRLPRLPWRALAPLLLVALLLKAWMFAALGGTAYEMRVAALAAGGAAGEVGAFVLQADPGTVWIGTLVRDLLR